MFKNSQCNIFENLMYKLLRFAPPWTAWLSTWALSLLCNNLLPTYIYQTALFRHNFWQHHCSCQLVRFCAATVWV